MVKAKKSPEAPPPEAPPEEALEETLETPPEEAPAPPPEEPSGPSGVTLEAPERLKGCTVNGNWYKVEYGIVVAKPEDVDGLIRMYGFSMLKDGPE